ncbi:MAG TPA: pyrroline-5-carboxylate reductase [Gemmatimonadetes bacterium]|nr:pyrroline-5-carboxylate reductase [Gemmatimonadota bacterium]
MSENQTSDSVTDSSSDASRSDAPSSGASSPGTLAILGGGNLGQALARGLVRSGTLRPDQIHVTSLHPPSLEALAAEGFPVGRDNLVAMEGASTVLLAVQPQQITDLIDEIQGGIDPERHKVISVVTGVSVDQLREMIPAPTQVVRAMPNTAVSIGESMTCLAANPDSMEALEEAETLFNGVGITLRIEDEMILRSVRAASQGGIEIGFHPEDALLLAAQTAKGAASLALRDNHHPESEIDRVTTPRGCTIAGLNEMEHQGFSSAMIKGFVLSARKAGVLFDDEEAG